MINEGHYAPSLVQTGTFELQDFAGAHVRSLRETSVSHGHWFGRGSQVGIRERRITGLDLRCSLGSANKRSSSSRV